MLNEKERLDMINRLYRNFSDKQLRDQMQNLIVVFGRDFAVDRHVWYAMATRGLET